MNERARRMVISLLLSVLVLACSDDSGSTSHGGNGGAGGEAVQGGSGLSDLGGSAVEGYPKPCSELYDPSRLPDFDVEISAAEWTAMRQDCQDGVQLYRSVVFNYAEESVEAMMRLKGNWSWNCDKMQFVISFNETDSDGRFHGLRKIVLDAPWYDPTVIRERLAFEYMKAYGAPYSCVNNARLSINGEYYGVYANVEKLDREYLERNFEDPDGNLFKAGTELKTNEATATNATVDAFWAATSLSEVEALVDVEQAVGIWAGLAMVPDPDSYWAGVEINFYLYEHPTRGLLFLPYDMDISFGENIWPELVSADPITYEHEQWLRELPYQLVLSDPTWCAAFEAAMVRARAAFDVTALESKIDAWSAQIAPALSEDPNRTFSLPENEEALAALRTFPRRRADFVDAWLAEGSHCPVQWPGR